MQINIFGAIVATKKIENTSVTNCYYLQGTCEGGINSEDITGQAEKRTAEKMQEESFVDTLNKGNETTVWKKDESNSNNGYPVLK